MMAAPQRLPVESRAAGPVFVLLAVVLILQTCGGRLAPAADGTTAREPQAHTATGFYFHPVLGIVAVYGNSTCVYQFAHPEVPGVKFTECRRLVEKAGEHMFFCHGNIKYYARSAATMYRKLCGPWVPVQKKTLRKK